MGSNFLAGLVLVEQDSGLGMGSFPGIVKAVTVFLKPNTVANQLFNDCPGGANHNVNRLGIVFIVSGLHGILKEGIIVRFVPEDTNAALGQEGIA